MENKKQEVKCSINIRLPKDNKPYYEHQLKEFCKKFDSEKVLSIQFGKQDTRGTESITLVDKRHCVPVQIFFYNKWEMLGFVLGYNEAKINYAHRLTEYIKKVD